MAQLARMAGVTKMTVSYALNGRTDQVGAATRQRILAIAREHDYVPNALVRAIQTKRSHLIGVQWNMLNASISFFGEILTGMLSVARAHGYDVLTTQTGASQEELEQQIRRFRELRVDGLLVSPCATAAAFYEGIQMAGMPLMFVESRIAGSAIPYAQSDDVLGARLAVRHLIDLGHRRIATFSNGARDGQPTQDRTRGYRMALREAGLPVDPDLVWNAGDASPAEVRDAVLARLQKTDFTALFVPTDPAAIAAIEAMREIGRRVPRDVAVVGYANLPEGAHLTPGLTTVDQKTVELGQLAMTALIARIEHPERRHRLRHVTIPELVIRESCGMNTPKRPGHRARKIGGMQ